MSLLLCWLSYLAAYLDLTELTGVCCGLLAIPSSPNVQLSSASMFQERHIGNSTVLGRSVQVSEYSRTFQARA